MLPNCAVENESPEQDAGLTPFDKTPKGSIRRFLYS